MSFETDNEYLGALMVRYLEGSVTAEEARELSLVLRNSPEARREFVRLSRQMVQLGTLGQESKVLPLPPGVFAGRKRRVAGWLLAAAACLAALIWFFSSHTFGPDSTDEMADESDEMVDTNAVATLVSGANLVWDSATNTDLQVGETIDPSVLRLKSGVVELEFLSGAQVILEGPAELDLISEGEARLNFGKLRAHVPEQARGFKVTTPGVVVTDLGTEFAMNQQPQKPPEVHVFVGKVELEFSNTNQLPMELTADQGAQVETNGVQKIPANQEEFVGPEELKRRETIELKERYDQWKRNSAALAIDPSMLVYFNFEEGKQGDTTISNQAKSKKPAIGRLSGTKWSTGRWPGKRSLRFTQPDDRVHLNVPGQFKSLTFLAWVYVDGLPHPYNSVAGTGWQKNGRPYLEITKKGELSFSVRASGKAAVNVRSLIFPRNKFRRWMQIAAVYNGEDQSMSLYADGRLIATRAADPELLTVGTLEIGNWPSKTDHRNFKGHMDEFALLSRALSAEEIQRFYESGRQRVQIAAQ